MCAPSRAHRTYRELPDGCHHWKGKLPIMDSTLFLQHLSESSLEEGRAYIQDHTNELADLDVVSNLLENEALKQLFNPFLSLKLSELLIFFGDFTHTLSFHALGLKAKGDALVQIRHYQAAL